MTVFNTVGSTGDTHWRICLGTPLVKLNCITWLINSPFINRTEMHNKKDLLALINMCTTFKHEDLAFVTSYLFTSGHITAWKHSRLLCRKWRTSLLTCPTVCSCRTSLTRPRIGSRKPKLSRWCTFQLDPRITWLHFICQSRMFALSARGSYSCAGQPLWAGSQSRGHPSKTGPS